MNYCIKILNCIIFVFKIEEAHYLRLVSHLHDLLLCDTKNRERKEDLQSHTVDLLTSMPLCSFEELLSPVNEFGKPENPEHEFHEMNVEVIAVLLEFLEKRLDNVIILNNCILNFIIIILFFLFLLRNHQTSRKGWHRY